jgi:Subtilase family/RTX calcium-binding nonapeptide repeat (4 copies)
VAAAACLLAVGTGIAVASAPRDFENPAQNTPADAQQQFGAASSHRNDTPNDPDYDYAETDDPDSTLNGGSVTPSTNLYDERFDLFGFPSLQTRLTATYLDGPNATACGTPPCPQISGFNASGAWKLDRGRPDVTVAILDTGIKWDKGELRTQIHLNTGELPVPNHARATPSSDASSVPGGSCANMASAYDANADGAVNVLDYVCDDRVGTAAGAHGNPGLLDAEDLIAAFSDSQDGDGNGFVDDIAGWDFFDNDNDPYDASSYFAAQNHGSGRAAEAVERGNDGSGGIGVCPHCQMIPIRVWDTFVSDGNTFGMGMVYATDNGASVIEGADGSSYHSAFAERASNYAYDHGVVQTYSGDDLNTGNHNYPANYGHAMLIEGTVPDTQGLGMDAGNDSFAQGLAGLCSVFAPPAPSVGCPGTTAPVKSYFRGANTTQYGGKSSISMWGATGSQNTGRAAGAAALVVSAGRDASPPVTLRPDETREILEQTAERVTSGNTVGTGTPDPGANPAADPIDQWTTHFGWGRVNLGKAVALAQSGEVPPEAAIDSPDWYAPETGDAMPVTGLARARFATNGNHFSWKLEWGAGEVPSSWTTAASGSSNGSVSDFGDIDMNAVRSALASYTPPPDTGGPTLSALSTNPYKNEFTVRLVVTGDGIPTKGVDRRVFTSAKDPTLRSGFPKRMGTGGEAPIRYADINGDNVQELIVPLEDGTVHAYEPDGSELPGWPVHTQLEKSAIGHDSAPGFSQLEQASAPNEPPRAPVIADLDNDGRPEIIVTAGIHIYVWEPDGTMRPGFPVASDLNFCRAADESQPLHHPKCGFAASAAVGRLQGQDQPLDIVAPSLDGHLYAVDGNGNPLNGFPVQLVDPAKAPSDQMIAESINEPAIGDLNGDGKDDIVAATNESYGSTNPDPSDLNGGFSHGLSVLLGNAAGGTSRVYAVHSDGNAHSGGPFFSGWPVHLPGAIQDTLPFIGPGQSPSIATIGGQQLIATSTTGSASIDLFKPNGTLDHSIQQGVYGPGSDATDHSGVINLFESASIGKLDPASGPAIVKYGLTIGDVANLALVSQNVPYNHLIGAYNAQTGAALPNFPRITDDFQFLSASNIGRVDGALPENQVIAGTGLGLLHAYDGLLGVDVPGFPKVTGGWLFSPAALSDDGRIADITREGYLFQWNQPSMPSCQTEWPDFRHDQQDTGNYDKDGTPPSTPTELAVSNGTLSFKAPGDDNACGSADHYDIATSDNPITPTNFAAAEGLAGAPSPGPAGSSESYSLPAHKRYVAVRAVDEAGNVGWDAEIDTGVPSGAAGGGGSNGGDGSQSGPCANLEKGTSGPDKLKGTSKGDRLLGKGGNDRISGRGGADCISGGSGDDRISGGSGRDKVSGGSGNDVINVAGGGRDSVDCGSGEDVVILHKGDQASNCETVRRKR